MAEGPSSADAIVVLGCTVMPDGSVSRALGRRLDLGARAYREGVAPVVIVSGGRRWGRRVEAMVMKEALVSRGVPERAVMPELCSLTTVENCIFTAELLGEGRRVFVATCSWHLPRAARNFARLGITTVRPPASWGDTPPPTVARRVRERVNTLLDWCMMPRARHA